MTQPVTVTLDSQLLDALDAFVADRSDLTDREANGEPVSFEASDTDASNLVHDLAAVVRAARERPQTVLSLTYTTADITPLAYDHDVPVAVARERAAAWADHIADTARQLIGEQGRRAVAVVAVADSTGRPGARSGAPRPAAAVHRCARPGGVDAQLRRARRLRRLQRREQARTRHDGGAARGMRRRDRSCCRAALDAGGDHPRSGRPAVDRAADLASARRAVRPVRPALR